MPARELDALIDDLLDAQVEFKDRLVVPILIATLEEREARERGNPAGDDS